MAEGAGPHPASTTIGRGGARVLGNRTLMRAPIPIYRAGFGFLFGSRLLLLEHVGRTSGAKRYVVLEVIGHPDRDTYVVASGFGERAQWYRNLMAEPRVRVSSGTRRSRPATARRLSPGEADKVLRDYARRHPRAWEKFKGILDNTLGQPVHLHNTRLPLVELRLDQG